MLAEIEERVLRRICHVFRMRSSHPTKPMTLGWYAPLVKPTPERKLMHGTIEAGLHADSIEHLLWDKGKWRKVIHEREVHLKKWKKSKTQQRGNQNSQTERSQAGINKQGSSVCQWPRCGKTLKPITGRKKYEKTHRANRRQEKLCR